VIYTSAHSGLPVYHIYMSGVPVLLRDGRCHPCMLFHRLDALKKVKNAVGHYIGHADLKAS